MKKTSLPKVLMYVTLCFTLIFVLGLMAGCKGSDGSAGAQGPQGPQGPQGVTGPTGAAQTTGVVDSKTLTFDDLRNISLGGTILSVDTSGNQPVVTFQVVNAKSGEGIMGLRTFSLHIAQLQPEANSNNSFWLNYILNSTNRPTTDPVTTFKSDGTVNVPGYQVVDHLDGTYTVTFGTNIKSIPTVTYNANLTHRVVVGVRSVVVPGVVGLTPGAYAGPINPITNAPFGQFTNTNGVNLFLDFVPATNTALTVPARDIVTIGACNECHYKIQYGSNNTSGHFGSRTDTKTCVMCHTPQNILSGQTATTNADFTPFIHKIHMGDRLPAAETQVGINLNEVTFPQDVRNCVKCHDGVLADNWNTKPTMKACGSCHNNISFVSPPPAGFVLHSGGAYADNTQCTFCHPATGGIAGVKDKHIPIVPPDPTDPRMGLGGTNTHTNSEFIAAAGVVPTGAHKINWVISSVTVSTNGNPSITFKFQSDGADVVFSTPTSSTSELMPGFSGSPSAYFVWSEPSVTSDGVAAPADFNKSASAYIKNVWNGTIASTTATMTGPDGSGFYTLTRTGTVIPVTAKIVTGGIGYSYGSASPPLVQTDLSTYPLLGSGMTTSGGLAVPAPNKYMVATGFTGRRIIVDTNKCNSCHAALGVEPTFHVGQRNDGPTCSFCHNPGRAAQGWAINANTFVHAIHAAAKRTVPFTWDGTSTTGDEADDGFFLVTYPGRGMLRNCEMCHVAGGYDFTNSQYTANSGAQDPSNMLLTTAATGTYLSTDPVHFDFSPYVQQDFPYGASGAGTNLVNSPITAACSACHDSSLAIDHMKLNGGSFYATRNNALTTTETCLVCHGPAANTAFGDFVPAIKSVHRWW